MSAPDTYASADRIKNNQFMTRVGEIMRVFSKFFYKCKDLRQVVKVV